MLTTSFLEDCDYKFNNNPQNVLSRNIVSFVGMDFAMRNSDAEPPNHIFTTTTKPDTLKASSQGYSGTCWLYSGFNMLRHGFMSDNESDNFEFSSTFLSFYDKLERANSILSQVITDGYTDINNRNLQYLLGIIGDGGYWHTFVELVEKYGLIPVSAMNKADSDEDSSDMNNVIYDTIYEAVVEILKVNDSKISKRQKLTKYDSIKRETMKKIYNILQMFFGRPPTNFDVYLENTKDGGKKLGTFTPLEFKNKVLKSINDDTTLHDFTVLFNNISLPMNKWIQFKNSEFVYGKGNSELYNTTKELMLKCVVDSIDLDIPVWFAGDIRKGFDAYGCSLSIDSIDEDLVFGKKKKFSKYDQHKYGLIHAEHAMLITGYNKNDIGDITEFQVENSWGYDDDRSRGEDGFFNMKIDWFMKYCVQVVIHDQLIDEYIPNFNCVENSDIIPIEPWDRTVSCARVKGTKMPARYKRIIKGKNNRHY